MARPDNPPDTPVVPPTPGPPDDVPAFASFRVSVMRREIVESEYVLDVAARNAHEAQALAENQMLIAGDVADVAGLRRTGIVKTSVEHVAGEATRL